MYYITVCLCVRIRDSVDGGMRGGEWDTTSFVFSVCKAMNRGHRSWDNTNQCSYWAKESWDRE